MATTSWPSGLRRNVKAVVLIGVGSNPTDVKLFMLLRRHANDSSTHVGRTYSTEYEDHPSFCVHWLFRVSRLLENGIDDARAYHMDKSNQMMKSLIGAVVVGD